jgi:hypothetical protein
MSAPYVLVLRASATREFSVEFEINKWMVLGKNHWIFTKNGRHLDFCYLGHFYASNLGGILQEYDFIRHIFLSK